MSLLMALVQADADAGAVAEIARRFGVDWPHFLAQAVSFFILCVLLYFVAYRPMLQMLEARRRQIAQGLANTAQIEAELARTRAERQEVLKQARDDAARVLEDGRAAAARVRAHETERALVAAEQ